jgi:plastocyanin
MKKGSFALVLASAAMLAACSGDTKAPDQEARAAAAPLAATVAPTGRVITVEMHTDGTGNYFKPRDIEARPGDVVRFVLVSGVHNVNFLPDSNRGRAGLPPASDYLQLPGQTWDYIVALAPGEYYFQCDPHALLGMVGQLEVEDDDDR